jgi:hypothetical protein
MTQVAKRYQSKKTPYTPPIPWLAIAGVLKEFSEAC